MAIKSRASLQFLAAGGPTGASVWKFCLRYSSITASVRRVASANLTSPSTALAPYRYRRVRYFQSLAGGSHTGEMTLFILTETAAGYALLKAKDKKLLKRDDLAEEAGTAEGISSMLKLKQFKKFESASSALEEAAALTEGKVSLSGLRLLSLSELWVHVGAP